MPPFAIYRSYFKRCNDEYLQKIKEDESENVLPHFELWITGNGNAGLAKDWLAFSAEYVNASSYTSSKSFSMIVKHPL